MEEESSECDRPICILFRCCSRRSTTEQQLVIDDNPTNHIALHRDSIGRTPMWVAVLWSCIVFALAGSLLLWAWYNTSVQIDHSMKESVYYRYVGQSVAIASSDPGKNEMPGFFEDEHTNTSRPRRPWPKYVSNETSWAMTLSPLICIATAFAIVFVFASTSTYYIKNMQTKSALDCIAILFIILFIAVGVAVFSITQALDDIGDLHHRRNHLLDVSMYIIDELMEQIDADRLWDTNRLAFARAKFKTLVEAHPKYSPELLFDAAMHVNSTEIEMFNGMIRLGLDPVDDFLIKTGMHMGESVFGVFTQMMSKPTVFNLEPTLEDVNIDLLKKQISFMRYNEEQHANVAVHVTDQFKYTNILLLIVAVIMPWISCKIGYLMYNRVRLLCFDEWDGQI